MRVIFIVCLAATVVLALAKIFGALTVPWLVVLLPLFGFVAVNVIAVIAAAILAFLFLGLVKAIEGASTGIERRRK